MEGDSGGPVEGAADCHSITVLCVSPMIFFLRHGHLCNIS